MGRIILKAILILFLWALAVSLWAEDQQKTFSSEKQVASYPTGESDKKGYVIGPGDVLDISVWKDETLEKVVTVLPDGKIFFPLIGEAEASGKTVPELKKEIEEKLSLFVPDPTLSIVVQKAQSMLIYVIGKVNNPGRFELNTYINVMQALSMAGGLNAYAKKSKIKIFREVEGKTEIFEFNYDKVSQGSNLEQNIRLKKGDLIVVP
jgi:polysaccharide export outer membrane protein